MLLVGGLLEFLEVHFKLPYPRFEVQKVPRQLLGDVQAGHPSLHCLVGTLWPGSLHFSCSLFGYPVVFVHDAPLCPISLRLPSYLPPKSTRGTLRGAVNNALFEPQVIAKRQLHSYILSPADDAPSPRPRYALRRAYRSVPGPCELRRSRHTEPGSTERPLPAEVPTPEPPGAGSRRSSP